METDKIKNDISSRYEYLKNNKVILGFLSEKISLVLNNRLHPRYIETEEFIKILSDGKNNFKNNMSTFFESIDEMGKVGVSKDNIHIITECFFQSFLDYGNIASKIKHIISTMRLKKGKLIDKIHYEFGGTKNIEASGIGGNCATLASYCYKFLSKNLSNKIKLEFVEGFPENYIKPHTGNHFFLQIIHNNDIWIYDPSFGIIENKKKSKYIVTKTLNSIPNQNILNTEYALGRITLGLNNIDYDDFTNVIGLEHDHIITLGFGEYMNNHKIIPMIITYDVNGSKGLHYYDSTKKHFFHPPDQSNQNLIDLIEKQLLELPEFGPRNKLKSTIIELWKVGKIMKAKVLKSH